MPCSGIALKYVQICFDINLADTVQGDEVKIPDTAVVFRWIAGRSDDPATGNGLITKGFALKKLEHGWSKGLGDAVNLIDKKNTFFFAGFFHVAVNTADNLAHSIFCDRFCLAVKHFLLNKRKPYSTLAGVVSDGIGDQTDFTFLCNLLHNLCF